MPLVFYAEGGGCPPGDTDRLTMTGLDGLVFARLAKVLGLCLVGVISGDCFLEIWGAGLLLRDRCDGKNTSIGSAGPATIDGEDLGTYYSAELGPVSL